MPVGWRAQGNLTTQDLVKPRETEDMACSEPTLRILSEVLLQQVARPSQTTVDKDVQKVGETQ